MANKDLSRHQQGIVKRYYEHHDTIQSHKLAELVSELWLAEDEKTKAKLWARAKTALTRVGVLPAEMAAVIDQHDLEKLAQLVSRIDAGQTRLQAAGPSPPTTDSPPRAQPAVRDTRTIGQMRRQLAAEGGYDSLDQDNLKRALKAFRRKLKTLRRDDESQLGNRYVTAGRTSNITAITPPSQYPMAVWNKLTELGRLQQAGGPTFELP